MNRDSLPFRKNCEGYFLFGNEIVALNTGKGYIEFPGGGVDEGEEPAEALIREAFEEAGVIIEGELNKIGVLHFIWGPDWAKTEKQRARYLKFKGEEMHLFSGNVKKMVEPKGDEHESGWKGKRTMKIKEVIDFIKGGMPFPEDIRKYREMQLKALEDIRKN